MGEYRKVPAKIVDSIKADILEGPWGPKPMQYRLLGDIGGGGRWRDGAGTMPSKLFEEECSTLVDEAMVLAARRSRQT